MATLAPPVHSETKKPLPSVQRKPIQKFSRFPLPAWLDRAIKKWRLTASNESVSFVSSVCIHVALFLILAIITTSITKTRSMVLFIASEPEFGMESIEFGIDGQDDQTSFNEIDSNLEDIGEANVELKTLSPVRDLSEVQLDSELPPSPVPSFSASETDSAKFSTVSTTTPGSGGLFAASSMEGRNPGNRRKFGMQNGATKESEAAVDAALEWLAAHQSLDGSWSTEMTDKPCNGRCTHGTEEIGSPKRIGATGLALLCFLGAGHTHREGPYKAEVYKAIQFLTSAIKRGPPNPRDDRENGRFLNEGSRYEMYEHGIAVLAMCEAYQMTADSILRGPVDAGIEFIEKSQHPNGSWGYVPNSSGDLSIVGWQLMALKSASHIGSRVRPDVIQRADKFLTSQQSEDGAYYGYRSTQKEACTTAIGLLIRLYRGWSRTDPRIMTGTQYIVDLGPSIDGIYYNYYATQLLFHMKYEKWAQWNEMNRDYLVREQAQQGHEKGSWYFGRNHFNQVGGRLYCTTMACLTLEVYYRFMPIYSDLEKDTFQL